MEASHGGSGSDSSSGDEWMDLSKSDYAKVIFSTLYWDADTGDVGCHFNLTETVNKTPTDYIGLFKVGYDNISQCLASKYLYDLESEKEAKLTHCVFKSEELPELSGFYQFLYITHDKEVCGASMPFEVKQPKIKDSSDDEIVTEKIEDDFLMVRHGLEQKNHLLETMINKYRNANEVLSKECKAFEQDKNDISIELGKAQKAINSVSQELEAVKKDRDTVFTELETVRKEKDAICKKLENEIKENVNVSCALYIEIEALNKKSCAVSAELEVVKEEKNKMFIEMQKLKKEEYEVSSELHFHKIQMNALSSKLESISNAYNEKSIETETYKSRVADLTSELEAVKKTVSAISIEKEKKETEMNERMLKKQLSTLDANIELKMAQLDEAEKDKLILQKEKDKLVKEVQEMRCFFANEEEYRKFRYMETRQEERLLCEQLEDANIMITVLENSKDLVRKEMNQLSDMLEKVKEELIQMKCENLVLKIQLEDNKGAKSEEIPKLKATLDELKNKLDEKKTEIKNKDDEIVRQRKEIEDAKKLYEKENIEYKKMKDSFHQMKCENIALKVYLDDGQKIKYSEDPYKTMQLRNDITDLRDRVRLQKLEIQQKSEEIHKLKIESQELSSSLEKETAYKKDMYCLLREIDSSIEEGTFDKEVLCLISKIKLKENELLKLNEECERKDVVIEQLNNEMKQLKENETAALEDANEKTSRVLEAAELYKKQYIKIEKLRKKLRENYRAASQTSSNSSVSASRQDSIGSSMLKSQLLNHKLKEPSPNKSDSDTGELVRSQTSLPDKDDKPSIEASSHEKMELLVEAHHQSLEPTFLTTEESEKDSTLPLIDLADEKSSPHSMFELVDSVAETPSSHESLQTSSGERIYNIPCAFCEKLVVVSSLSTLPMVEHYETDHNMIMCPICGQLFDKAFPSKYLTYHVDKHFKSD